MVEITLVDHAPEPFPDSDVKFVTWGVEIGSVDGGKSMIRTIPWSQIVRVVHEASIPRIY